MEVKGAAKLQKKFHQAWLVCGTLEAAGSYWQAKQNATNMVKQLSRAQSGSKPLDNSGEKAASSLHCVYWGWDYSVIPDIIPSTTHPTISGSERNDLSINGGEVTETVKQLHGGRASGMDEIHPALDAVGLSWLTHLCNTDCNSQGQGLWIGRLGWFPLSRSKACSLDFRSFGLYEVKEFHCTAVVCALA